MKKYCLLIYAFLLLPAAIANDKSADEADNAPLVLQGGVEHSVKLLPVDKSLRKGAKLSSELTANQIPGNNWYEIPNWAAGTWTSTVSTRTYALDLLHGREQLVPETRATKMEFSWGFQQDSDGHIWEYAKEPYTLTLDTSAGHKMIKRVLKREFLQANEYKIVLKVMTENVVVDSSSNQIIRTVQVENIQSCKPKVNDCMSCAASFKVFDEMGKAIELGREVNTAKKLQAFKSIDEYQGKNMQQLFKEFMASRGR